MTHNRPTALALGAAVAASGTLLALAPMAAAQGPPPALPAPPAGVGQSAPDTSSLTASNANTPPPANSPGPSILPRPAKPVSMAGSSALRGRVLKVGLSCTRSGSVKVSYRRQRAGAASFKCVRSKATARVKLARKPYLGMKKSKHGALKVTARAGGSSTTRTLRFKQTKRGGVKIAAWAQGPHGYFNATGYCDFDVDHERSLYSFTGLLASPMPGGDHFWLRFWAYTDGYGWQQMTDWWGAHSAPQEGLGGFNWVTSALFYPAKEKWTAGYMELWSYKAGRSYGDWLMVDQLGAGGLTVTSGAWCYPKI